jgi:uncharacterized iron-regulated membrane protein
LPRRTRSSPRRGAQRHEHAAFLAAGRAVLAASLAGRTLAQPGGDLRRLCTGRQCQRPDVADPADGAQPGRGDGHADGHRDLCLRCAVGVRGAHRIEGVDRHRRTDAGDAAGHLAAAGSGMKQGFRQSMAWLHTWSGLLVSWLLLLIFMGGTASYYRDEISRWMRPELPRSVIAPDVAAANAVRFLQAEAPNAEYWNVTLPSARNPALEMFWMNPVKDGAGNDRASRRERFGQATLDAATGQKSDVRQTRGGDFFYRLHFDLHYIPVLWARYLVGFCAMFMLVAIITGVITHKKIFKDFFTFRPRKGQRSWLDFHNISAVMALPYHLMITYTGIVTLLVMYLPLSISVAYPEGAETFYTESFSDLPEARPAAGHPGSALPIAQLLASARAEWNGKDVESFRIDHPGDAAQTVGVYQRDGRRLSRQTPGVSLDAATGQVIARSGDAGNASATRDVMYGLHIAHFADAGLRLLFFASGLLGCLMVASGAVLWGVKERTKHARSGKVGFGLRLVDALNIGAVAGLPVAFASYFWANRLLPLGLAERADAEANAFFIVWGVCILAGFIWPRRQMWAWLLYLACALFSLIPVLNAFTTHIHLGVTLRNGDWALAGVDLVTCAIGLVLGYCGRRMQRWQPPVSAAEKRRRQVQASQPASEGGAA